MISWISLENFVIQLKRLFKLSIDEQLVALSDQSFWWPLEFHSALVLMKIKAKKRKGVPPFMISSKLKIFRFLASQKQTF